MFGVATEKLDPDRPFDLVKVEIAAGPLVTPEYAFGRDKLGNQNSGATFLAKWAENLVRPARHGREVKGKAAVRKPEKHSHLVAALWERRKLSSSSRGGAKRS